MMPPVAFLGPPSLYVLMWLLYVNTKHDLLLESVGCPELQQVLYKNIGFASLLDFLLFTSYASDVISCSVNIYR